MKVFHAPELVTLNQNPYIFLAGTIDMGNSVDWQKETVRLLDSHNVNVLNPRRESWDSSWVQSYSNPEFFQQVTWELHALERSDIIIFNFIGSSSSPITLMELGLFLKTDKKIFVCCPEFYRSGNIQMVCDYYNQPLYTDFNEMLLDVIKEI